MKVLDEGNREDVSTPAHNLTGSPCEGLTVQEGDESLRSSSPCPVTRGAPASPSVTRSQRCHATTCPRAPLKQAAKSSINRRRRSNGSDRRVHIVMRLLHVLEHRRDLLKDLRPLIERDVYVGLPYAEWIGFQGFPAQSQKNVLSLKLSHPGSISQFVLQSQSLGF